MSFGGVPVAHLLGDDDMVAASTILVPLARDREIARWRPLEGGSPLTLIALAKDVSCLNIRDPHEPVRSPHNSPGQAVRFPSVTGESEFSPI